MTEEFDDPPEPEEIEAPLRAKDLKGQAVILVPRELGEWEPKEDEKKGQPFVSCSAWVFDRAGVTHQSDNVRISWVRAYGQLREMIGHYVAGRVVENDDRSITIERIAGPLRETAAKIVQMLKSEAMQTSFLDDDPEAPF